MATGPPLLLWQRQYDKQDQVYVFTHTVRRQSDVCVCVCVCGGSGYNKDQATAYPSGAFGTCTNLHARKDRIEFLILGVTNVVEVVLI